MENSAQPALRDEIKQARRFYSVLRNRIARWLRNRRVPARISEYLLLLPDLFALLLRLIRDPRIALPLKVQLLTVTTYVVSPVDLVPDALLPAGLVDDTVAVAFILNRLATLMGQAGEDVLREHWEGQGDALARIQGVVRTADTVLNARVLGGLRKLLR